MAQPMDPRQGDSLVCFENFYRHEYRLLLEVVMLIGGTLDEAHDTVNQTMETLIPRWAKIRHPHKYVRVAVVSNFIKYKKRDRQGLQKAVEGGYLVQEAHDCPELTVWEDKQWVEQLVSSLPRAQREATEAILEGLTIEEIAEELGRTPEAIRKSLERAKHRLGLLREERGQGHDGGEAR